MSTANYTFFTNCTYNNPIKLVFGGNFHLTVKILCAFPIYFVFISIQDYLSTVKVEIPMSYVQRTMSKKWVNFHPGHLVWRYTTGNHGF